MTLDKRKEAAVKTSKHYAEMAEMALSACRKQREEGPGSHAVFTPILMSEALVWATLAQAAATKELRP